MLQALCNALNKDYRSFQARFALGIHGGMAESRFASCRREEKLVEVRFHVLRSRAPFLILSPFDQVSFRRDQLSIPNVRTAFSMYFA